MSMASLSRLGHDPHHGQEDGRVFADQPFVFPGRDEQDAAVLERAEVGGQFAVRKGGAQTERFAGPEHEDGLLLAVLGQTKELHLSGQEHVQPLGRVVLAEEQGFLGEPQDLGVRGDALELGVVEPFEHGKGADFVLEIDGLHENPLKSAAS